MNDLNRSIRDAAVRYATELGWAVFPLFGVAPSGGCACGKPKCDSQAKHPATENGLINATTDTDQIRQWFNTNKPRNLGIVTGRKSGLAVIDVDYRHGGLESLNTLIAQLGPERFETITVKTGDGKHLYFRYPSSAELRNSTSRLGPGLDIRGEGGYVVAPPSAHVSGKSYEFENSFTSLCDFPDECLVALNGTSPSSNGNGEAARRSPGSERTPKMVVPGARNSTLASIAGKMRYHGLGQEAIENALLAENERVCQPPLNSDEVRKIARSISRYPPSENLSPELSTLGMTKQRRPLPVAETFVPKLDPAMLPEPWRTWLEDISDRLQCPLEYPTVAALIGAAALIGNRVRVRPKNHDPWMPVPNLWGAIVGSPGVMKTPAVNEGLIFFKEIAEQERISHQQAIKDLEFEHEYADAKRKEISRKLAKATPEQKTQLREEYESLKTEEPTERRLWTSDVTVEKLGELLNENPHGLLILRDELTGFFRGLDRQGHEQDRAFFLETWNGEGAFTFDRIGRGKTHVNNMTVSLLGTIQPSMIEPYLRGSLEGYGDDGLIQRLQLLVYPEPGKNYRYVDRIPKGRDAARKSFRALHDFDPMSVGARRSTDDSGGLLFMPFAHDAQDFFREWLEGLELALRSETFDTSLESHLAKYRSLMPSLALIFHLIDRLCGVSSSDRIEVRNVQRAAAWCSYLQKHAEKLYGMALMSDYDRARAILKKLESGALVSGFTARDVYGRHWKGLRKPEEVRQSLEILVDYGHLTAVTINEGHRPKTVYLTPEEGT